MVKFLIFVLIMTALVVFIWHGEITNWLSSFQQTAENKGPEMINQSVNQANEWWLTYGQDWSDKIVAKLTAEGKQKIDEWLSSHQLNQYGDKVGTVYAGGTPLFNEATNQVKDRYSYLLSKYPDLLNQLHLDQYLK